MGAAAPISPGAMARIREARRLARPQSDADWIDAIADKVNRLMLKHTDPEAFYVERSEISGDLRRLARHMRGR